MAESTARTLLNNQRPPVFCPGCSHESSLKALDRAFMNLGLPGNRICMVSDIGCSGLFDTFFNTHALHGLHGRALTYATGIKLCRPDLNVVVTMGDGGLGIGGAHLLSACRRNVDITLLVLNNFNFGMTGGQSSATSPADALLSSGFLNQIEKPFHLRAVAAAAGAAYVDIASAYQPDLADVLEKAIRFKGFSIVGIQGICPGRYTRRNKITPQDIEVSVAAAKGDNAVIDENMRTEYAAAYRSHAAAMNLPERPLNVEKRFDPPQRRRNAVLILGAAGQRVITAGELVGWAAMCSGLRVTQKNEYNITVLRGPSITELLLSPDPIHYAGIGSPDTVLALSQEGIDRRQEIFGQLTGEAVVIGIAGLQIPTTDARVVTVDFKAQGIKKADWALAAIAVMAIMNRAITPEMLNAALEIRFRGNPLASARELVSRVQK